MVNQVVSSLGRVLAAGVARLKHKLLSLVPVLYTSLTEPARDKRVLIDGRLHNPGGLFKPFEGGVAIRGVFISVLAITTRWNAFFSRAALEVKLPHAIVAPNLVFSLFHVAPLLQDFAFEDIGVAWVIEHQVVLWWVIGHLGAVDIVGGIWIVSAEGLLGMSKNRPMRAQLLRRVMGWRKSGSVSCWFLHAVRKTLEDFKVVLESPGRVRANLNWSVDFMVPPLSITLWVYLVIRGCWVVIFSIVLRQRKLRHIDHLVLLFLNLDHIFLVSLNIDRALISLSQLLNMHWWFAHCFLVLPRLMLGNSRHRRNRVTRPQLNHVVSAHW